MGVWGTYPSQNDGSHDLYYEKVVGPVVRNVEEVVLEAGRGDVDLDDDDPRAFQAWEALGLVQLVLEKGLPISDETHNAAIGMAAELRDSSWWDCWAPKSVPSAQKRLAELQEQLEEFDDSDIYDAPPAPRPRRSRRRRRRR